MLQIFDGFGRDQVCDITGLSKTDLANVVKQKIVQPERTRVGYKYTFQDLIFLRLINTLRTFKVSVKNIRNAHHYLKDINPSKSLIHYALWLGRDSKKIFYLGEEVDPDYIVSASDFGQLYAKGMILIIPVGKHLEETRKEVIDLDKRLARSLRSTKVIPLETVKKNYGVR